MNRIAFHPANVGTPEELPTWYEDVLIGMINRGEQTGVRTTAAEGMDSLYGVEVSYALTEVYDDLRQ